MNAKSMIRLVCPLRAVDSPKNGIALKVVQILLGKPWFNVIFWRCHRYFPYKNDIIRLTGEGFITTSWESNIIAPPRVVSVSFYFFLVEKSLILSSALFT